MEGLGNGKVVLDREVITRRTTAFEFEGEGKGYFDWRKKESWGGPRPDS